MILTMDTLANKSKSCTMMGILIFLLLNEVKQVYTDKIMTIDNSTCGTYFNANFYKSGVVEHVGSDLLYVNPCTFEIYKFSDEQHLCVKGQEMELDCGTVLEYYEDYSTSQNIYKECFLCNLTKTFTCNNESLEEWCSPVNVHGIFIAIRKSAVSTADVIKLQVYVKDLPNRNRGASNITLYIVIPIVAAVVFILIAMYARMKARNRNDGFAQVAYQTTSPSGKADMNGETHEAART